ncbi:hypothetical protein D3C75_401670 [compost metagenome]
MVSQRLGHAIPGEGLTQEGFGALGQVRHDGFEVGHQHPEQVDADGADVLQLCIRPFLLGDDPGSLVIHIAVGLVGERHDLADGAAELTGLVGIGNRGTGARELVIEFGFAAHIGQLAVETLGDKAGVAGSQIDQLVDHVRIDPGDEVFEVQVQIVDATVELGCVVVTQALGIQVLQVGGGLDEGALGLGHLGAVDGHIAVHVDLGRLAETRPFQHGRPEQAVEVGDVLADEVIELGVGVCLPVAVEVDVAALVAQVLERRHIADGGIQPDVEVLARGARDLEAEVGGVAGDVPLLQAGFEPLLHLVGHLFLDGA